MVKRAKLLGDTANTPRPSVVLLVNTTVELGFLQHIFPWRKKVLMGPVSTTASWKFNKGGSKSFATNTEKSFGEIRKISVV